MLNGFGVEVSGGLDGVEVVGVEVAGGDVVVGFDDSAGLLDSAGFGGWLFAVGGAELSAVGAVASSDSSISGVEVSVFSDSVGVVGVSVDSSGSVVEVSPAEKEDEGAGDSSLPSCAAFCEQPINETVKTAAIKNMLAFLILKAPFRVYYTANLKKCNSTINIAYSFSAGRILRGRV